MSWRRSARGYLWRPADSLQGRRSARVQSRRKHPEQLPRDRGLQVRRKRQAEKIRESKVSVARAHAETAQLDEAAVKAASVAPRYAAAGRAESTPSPRSIRSDRAEVRQTCQVTPTPAEHTQALFERMLG
jgi:hypothetical protein